MLQKRDVRERIRTRVVESILQKRDVRERIRTQVVKSIYKTEMFVKGFELGSSSRSYENEMFAKGFELGSSPSTAAFQPAMLRDTRHDTLRAQTRISSYKPRNFFSPGKRHISAPSEGRIGPKPRVGAPPDSSRLRGPPRNHKFSEKMFFRCCYTIGKEETTTTA